MKPEPNINVTVSQSQISAVLGLVYNYIHSQNFNDLSRDEQELILTLDSVFAQAEDEIYSQLA
jgi:hypothetical protein